MLEVELKTGHLDRLIKSLSGELPSVKVGILGAKTARHGSTANTNAAVGLKHEFGQEGMPIRSFLRMPLTEQMQRYLDNSKAFTKDVLKDVLAELSIIPWLKKIGIIGETIVLDGFNSGGFGKWKPSIMTKKRNHQTLVETQQLRNSISSEVEE